MAGAALGHHVAANGTPAATGLGRLEGADALSVPRISPLPLP